LVVTNFLHRGHCRRPVDRTLEWHEMLVGAPAIVVDVCRDEVTGSRFDGVEQIPLEMSVAEIETNAYASSLEVLFDEVHERSRSRQLVRDDFDRDPHAAGG